MARKGDQETLPGVPGPAKRKIVDAIEELCLDRDKQAAKRTAISDKVAELGAQIQAKLAEHKLEVYTYEDSDGILQDVYAEPQLKRRKSKLNPKKSKGEEKSE